MSIDLAEKLRLKLGEFGSKAIQLIDMNYKLVKVDPLTKKMRIAICEGCEHFTKTRQCGICTCPMDYKTSLKYDPIKGIGKDEPVPVTCALPEGKRKW